MTITATVTPAPRRSLTTVERYRAVMPDPGAPDAKIEALIGQTSAAVERFCARVFARERVIEELEGRHGIPALERTPVVELHAVTVDSKPAELVAFTIADPAGGIVEGGRSDRWYTGLRSLRPGPAATYRVDYTGGYLMPDQPGSTLPLELEEACHVLVQAELARQGRPFGLVSQRLGDYATSFANPQLLGWDRVRPVLERHRRLAL